MKKKTLKDIIKGLFSKIHIITTIVIVGIGTITYYIYFKPVAYLSIDINPSIELGINRFDYVVTKVGYNTDGKEILEDLKLFGKSIDDSVDLITGNILKGDYISADGKTAILITASTDDKELSKKILEKAHAKIQVTLKLKNKTAIIYEKEVEMSYHKKATKEDMSAGKYSLIKIMEEYDSNLNVENYKDENISNIISKIDEYTGTDTTSGATTKSNNTNGKNTPSTDTTTGATSTTGTTPITGGGTTGSDTISGATSKSESNSSGSGKANEDEAEDETEDETELED